MSELTPLPVAKDVRDLLSGLLGRDVAVAAGASMVDPAAGHGALVGTYVDGSLGLGALVLLDLELAAHSGAAIALLPPRIAEEAVADGALPENILENASEVLNVLAALLNTEGAPHLRLRSVHAPGDVLPADVAAWAMTYVRRCDLAVDVVGYGTGHFSLLVL